MIYIVGAAPQLFFDSSFLDLFPLVCGGLVLWITTTTKFQVFVLHRVKMGNWRREQLKKNVIRREVVRENKAKAKQKKVA